jgi:hypothetical protein
LVILELERSDPIKTREGPTPLTTGLSGKIGCGGPSGGGKGLISLLHAKMAKSKMNKSMICKRDY